MEMFWGNLNVRGPALCSGVPSLNLMLLGCSQPKPGMLNLLKSESHLTDLVTGCRPQ